MKNIRFYKICSKFLLVLSIFVFSCAKSDISVYLHSTFTLVDPTASTDFDPELGIRCLNSNDDLSPALDGIQISITANATVPDNTPISLYINGEEVVVGSVTNHTIMFTDVTLTESENEIYASINLFGQSQASNSINVCIE